MPGYRLPDKLRFRVLSRDGFRCRYCGAQGSDDGTTGVRLEVDHVVPRARGGTDEESNLVTACAPCNNGKGADQLVPGAASGDLRRRKLVDLAIRMKLSGPQQAFAEELARIPPADRDPVAAARSVGIDEPEETGPRWAALPKVLRFVAAITGAMERGDDGRFKKRSRRGGQPGNTNAIRHTPWRSFLKRRALRPEDAWIEPVLRRYLAEIVDDLGGETNLSSAEMHVLEQAQIARGVVMLVMSEARKWGAMRMLEDGSFDLHPGLAALPKFLAAERQALEAVGLKRRPRDIDPLMRALEVPAEPGRETDPGPAAAAATRPPE